MARPCLAHLIPAMYLPKAHRLEDPATLLTLIEAQPLGAWVCIGTDGLQANHIPFLLDRSRGPHGTLLGHVARANPVVAQWQNSAPSVVMFQGPQAYITPGWYPGATEHGQVVPTWNYVVAHVHGQAQLHTGRDWMRDMLQRLTDAQEARQARPWRMADAPDAFIDRLLRGIVGVEIPIQSLVGKCKASQDEDRPDREGTVQGLRCAGGEQALAMARWVEAALADL